MTGTGFSGVTMQKNHEEKDIWTYLTTVQKPVVLYGTGNGADKILDQLENRNIRISGIFASSDFVRDRTFRGHPVESFESLRSRLQKESGMDPIVLLCFGTSRPEVLENIDRIAKECEVYAPDVPVYGQNLFDHDFYKAHEEDLRKVRECLSDDLSRQTLDATIRYKLSGDYTLLRDCEENISEAKALLSLPKESTFLDLGAYNGDTLLLYTSLFPNISRAIGVEPDARNFRKLQENTSSLSERIQISYVRALISDQDGLSSIDRSKGRGVHEETSKTGVLEELPAKTIGSLSCGRHIDLIKMDIEGNEKLAILGGQDVITRDRPSLIVSCYHRSEDLFTLPLLLKEMVPQYKIYMRHHPHLLCWDTEFLLTVSD